MISSYLERSRLAQVLRASRSLLGGSGEAQLPPREPYVQGITTSSAVICWVNERLDVGVVEYGETLELGRKETDARVGRRHTVALAGLDPGSTYYSTACEASAGPIRKEASAPPPRATTTSSFAGLAS